VLLFRAFFSGGEGVCKTIAFQIFPQKNEKCLSLPETSRWSHISFLYSRIRSSESQGISIMHIFFSWTKNTCLFLQNLQPYLTIITATVFSCGRKVFLQETGHIFRRNKSVKSLCKSLAKNSVPGLNTQPADMHMASNHAGSLAGFKSHGEMRFYTCCCSIPTHTQRQDPWDTCRSIF